MWERVAERFNAERERGSAERDWESLGRKFRSLYGKPKPTGRNGVIPPRLKPVALAKEIQHRIEQEGGVQLTHDGLDQGEDDDSLVRTVEEVTGATSYYGGASARSGGRGDGNPDASGSGLPRSTGTLQEEGSDGSDADGGDRNGTGFREDQLSGVGTQDRGDVISQYAQRSTPSTPLPAALGTVRTSSGDVNASLVAEFGLSPFSAGEDDADEAADEVQRSEGSSLPSAEATGSTPTPPSQEAREATPATQTVPSAYQVDALPHEGQDVQSQPFTSIDDPPARRTTPRSNRRSASTAAVAPAIAHVTSRTPGTVGRPRVSRRELLETVVTPDGPSLRRNPARAVADASELERNPNMDIGSNRLGGRDIRILRDNISTMTDGALNENGKRSPSDGSKPEGSTPFGKQRRVRAKARVDEIQRELEAFEKQQVSTGSEMMQMLMFLQQDSDRKAEAEERRRRAEREERRDAERQEREERERIRQEIAEAAERRRVQDAQEARELREDQRRVEAAREAKQDQDREENKRRYEERLAAERTEARERHEQMLLVLAKLQKD